MPWHLGYPHHTVVVWPDGGVASDLDGSAATRGTYRVPADALLIGWGAVVSEVVVATSTAPVESIALADADGTTNESEKDTLTIPNGAAVGTVYQRDIANGNGIAVTKGRSILLKHKTAGAGGTTSGIAYLFLVLRFTGAS